MKRRRMLKNGSNGISKKWAVVKYYKFADETILIGSMCLPRIGGFLFLLGK
jgi:hypothetical protein